MLDFIKHVVYINLDERTDRKEEVAAELESVFPPENVHRFSAIRHSNGAIGCSQSHIAVIEMAKENGWENVLVVEDDFMWMNKEAGIQDLERYATAKYDVVLLSATFSKSKPVTNKVVSAQSAIAYLVPAHYYDTLLQNYRKGVTGLLSGAQYNTHALDQYWKRLQVHDEWYIVNPKVCKQRPSYSDIEKRFTDYTRYF
jgi:GR25 family glycosyltransferase involved in LPS biosynthesis